MNNNLWRSVVAVLAGALAGIVLSIGTDKALYAAGVFTAGGQPMGDALFVLATAYRTFYAVLGAYLTARLAPGRPMTHALVLGFLGLAATIAGAVATWNKLPAMGPRWYPIALMVLALPPAWVGAKLRLLQQSAQTEV